MTETQKVFVPAFEFFVVDKAGDAPAFTPLTGVDQSEKIARSQPRTKIHHRAPSHTSLASCPTRFAADKNLNIQNDHQETNLDGVPPPQVLAPHVALRRNQQ